MEELFSPIPTKIIFTAEGALNNCSCNVLLNNNIKTTYFENHTNKTNVKNKFVNRKKRHSFWGDY